MKMIRSASSPVGLCLLLSGIAAGTGLVVSVTHSHKVIAFAASRAVTPSTPGSKEEAFGVLHDFTRSVDNPRWEDPHWKTYCELKLHTLCSPPPSSSDPTPEIEASQKLTVNLTTPPQHPTGQPQPLSIFQSIYYNPGAARWITTNGLNNAQTLLTSLNQPPPAVGTRIVTSPTDPQSTSTPDQPGTEPQDLLVVVKTDWELIQTKARVGSGTTARTMDGYLKLLINPVNFTTLAVPATNNTSDVLVDVTHPKDASCNRLADYNGARVYSLNCFFHRRLTAKDVNKAGMLPKALQDDMKSGDCMQGNCYLILVGIHLISNESPTWTWRTYWWTATKSGLQWKGGVLAGNKWCFFDANATVDGKAPVANPYLEGSVTGGMKSNCIGCHQFAARAPQKSDFSPFLTCATAPSSLPVNCPDSAAYFAKSVRTHFLWTIALNDRCVPDISNPAAPCPVDPALAPNSVSAANRRPTVSGVK